MYQSNKALQGCPGTEYSSEDKPSGWGTGWKTRWVLQKIPSFSMVVFLLLGMQMSHSRGLT